MNPTAMCENSLQGTDSSHGVDGRLYYFQRQRFGNGTNQATQSHKATGRASYQISPRTSINGLAACIISSVRGSATGPTRPPSRTRRPAGLPTRSRRAPRSTGSINGFLTVASDKNNEMNIYEYNRDLLTPGLNLWTAPSDNLLFTLGWTYNKVTSNANMCVPIFDG